MKTEEQIRDALKDLTLSLIEGRNNFPLLNAEGQWEVNITGYKEYRVATRVLRWILEKETP